jgi:predicted membrane channel-forming protein YqfA (hemolysin III family)
MKNMKSPAFITFIVGALLVFTGIGMKANSAASGNIVLYIGFALMGLFWILSIVKVVTAPDMKPFQKRFWLISVVAVPVLGGLIFHIMHRKAGKIVS